MKKYIELHYYFNDYRCSANKIYPVLIDVDSIKLVLRSGNGSIVSIDNGESMNVVETIEEIKNMLDNKK